MNLNQIGDILGAIIYIMLAISIGALIKAVIKEKNAKKTPRKSNKKTSKRTWYKTGWTWNEQAGEWEPPDYLNTSNDQPSGYRFKKGELIKDDTVIKRHTPNNTHDQTQKPYTKEPETHDGWSNWQQNPESGLWEEKKEQTPPKETPEIDTTYHRIPNERTEINSKPKENSKKYDDQWKGWNWAYDPNQQGNYTPRSTQRENSKNTYRAADILTQNERKNYKILKEAADRKGYIICPKVRLADIITPRKGANYMSYFGKIKSKHIDFVIYDANMQHLKVLIELDDDSHNRPDRQERDRFVDAAVQEAGYKIIHTRQIKSNILDGI